MSEIKLEKKWRLSNFVRATLFILQNTEEAWIRITIPAPIVALIGVVRDHGELGRVSKETIEQARDQRLH